ncbi:MAG: ATP-binding protein [Anaerovoracaceae bacterium]
MVNNDKIFGIALKHSSLTYFEYDIKNHIAYANNKTVAVEIAGDKLENFPESFMEYYTVHKEDQIKYTAAFKNIDQGSMYEEFYARIYSVKAKRFIWYFYKCTVILDENRQPDRAICTVSNVNEFKELEQAYILSTETYGVQTWQYDLDTDIMYFPNGTGYSWSKEGEEALENAIETIIERGTIHPNDVDIYYRIFERMRDGENKVEEELRLYYKTHKDFRWTRVTYFVLKKNQGDHNKILGTCIDIHEANLEKIRYENGRLRQKTNLPNNFLLSAYSSLTNNQVVEIDNSMGEDFSENINRPREELLQRIFAGVRDKDKLNEMISDQNLIGKYEKGQTEHYFSSLVNSIYQNKTIYMHIKIEVAKNTTTGELMSYMTVTDETVQYKKDKMLEKTIDNSFNILVGVDELTEDVFHVFTNSQNSKAGEKKGLIKDNKKGKDIYEEKLEIAQGMEAILEEFSMSKIRETLKTQDVYSKDISVKYKDGKTKVKNFKSYYGDKEIGLICISVTDITESVEEQAKQQQALEDALDIAHKANHAKSDFLASMSHDIRTPMNAIVGMAEIALSDTENIEQMRESLDIISKSSAHLLSLLNNILDMSKIESGVMDLEVQDFSHQEEYENLIERTEATARGKNINFVHVDRIKNVKCRGDFKKVRRVLDNLIGNAIKFTPEGGTIKVEFDELPYGRKNFTIYQFTITDNGIGMDEETTTHIFDTFYRSNAVDLDYQGTGLGLSIVKSIVEFLGGDIKVSSKLGQGTTFIVTMPVPMQVNSKEKGKNNQLDITKLAGKKILACEDHPINRIVVSKLLEKIALKVDMAKDGAEGVNQFNGSSEGEYAAILMDIRMPVMDGLEAARQIRKSSHKDAKDIPIIAMTANAFVQDVQKSLDAGMNWHIAKPIVPEKLYEALAQTI